MTRCRLLSLASVLILLTLPPAGASAQGAPDASYDALVREGLAEFQARHWVEAYNLFRQAHAVSPNARTLRGMGMASYELGEYPRAIEQLRAALDSSVKPLAPDQQVQVQELIERAARLVGTLDVRVQPATATLLVNDVVRKPGRLMVPVGRTTVRAELSGHASDRRVVMVDGGQRYAVNLELQPNAVGFASSPAVPAATAPTVPAEGAVSPTGADPSSPSDDDSLWSNPWLWTGVGAAVVAGVLSAVLLSGGDGGGSHDVGALPEGNVGVSFDALTGAGK